jgi:thiopeptide-type bacteriocin biosynthesis protein
MTARTSLPGISHHGWFLLRTPLLPFDRWVDWNQSTKSIQENEPISSREERLRQELMKALTPQFTEALFFASPGFVAAVSSWMNGTDGRKGRSVENKLVAFFCRMSARPTPFGLFAGYTFGEISTATELELRENTVYRRHVSIDFRVVNHLSRILELDETLFKKLHFHLNSTIYKSGDRLKMVAFKPGTLKKNLRFSRLVIFDLDELLKRILDAAQESVTASELSCKICSTGDDTNDAEAFLKELVQEQVLISELAVSISGPDPATLLAKTISGLDPESSVGKELAEVVGRLVALNKNPIGSGLAGFQEATESLRCLSRGAFSDDDQALHADLEKPAVRATLGLRTVDRIAEAVRILQALSTPVESSWDDFKREFLKRYGSAEVPLVDALDDELGLSFLGVRKTPASDLLEGLFPNEQNDSQSLTWGRKDAKLLTIVSEALLQGKTEIVLPREQYEALAHSAPGPLLSSFSVIATLIADSPSDSLAEDSYRIAISGYAPSSAFYGRFCSHDLRLEESLLQLLRAEEACEPEMVFAEIVHYPAGEELGNIVCRPHLSEFEIPFGASSSLPPERQIPITDLLVSIREDEVVLRSRRLRKRVMPRLSVAHAFGKKVNNNFYKFLCGIPLQKIQHAPLWRWSPVFSSMPFLPRLVYKHTLIAPASWLLTKAEISLLSACTDAELLPALDRLRQSRRIPAIIVLKDGEQYVPVDLQNALSARSFVSLIKKRAEVRVSELLPGPGDLIVKDREGRFHHELIVPFTYAAEPAAARRMIGPLPDYSLVGRVFVPGSEWLYIKIYSSPLLLDRILIEKLGPLLKRMERCSELHQWFFLRYEDPDHHLRIRFKVEDSSQNADILSQINTALEQEIRSGVVQKVVVDTYVREIERYGGPEGIGLAETAFWIDSRAALKTLELDEASQAANQRIRSVVAGIDRLLRDFDESMGFRISMVRSLRDQFGQEFALTSVQRQAIGRKFRQHRNHLLNGIMQESAPFHARSESMREIVRGFNELAREGKLAVSMQSIVSSLVHMHVNRMIRSEQRKHEVVIYDLLYRTYDSILAQDRQTSIGRR